MNNYLDKWFEIKINIHNKKFPDFTEKEIWWCFVGKNVGVEKNGDLESFQRPVLIIKKINSKMAVVIPLTKRLREDDYRKTFIFNGDFSTADISHIKSIDTRRLNSKIGNVSDYVFDKIKKAVTIFAL